MPQFRESAVSISSELSKISASSVVQYDLFRRNKIRVLEHHIFQLFFILLIQTLLFIERKHAVHHKSPVPVVPLEICAVHNRAVPHHVVIQRFLLINYPLRTCPDPGNRPQVFIIPPHWECNPALFPEFPPVQLIYSRTRDRKKTRRIF